MHDGSDHVAGGVAWLLRAEGLFLLTAAALLYARLGLDWRLFAVFFLAPDLSILVYLAGSRAGALAYNCAHTTIGPVILAGVSLVAAGALPFALIWAAHIGFDRMLGYGLKYADGFTHTHLGRIGRREHAPIPER